MVDLFGIRLLAFVFFLYLAPRVLDHRLAFFFACLIPARNACDTILAYPAWLIDAITAAAVPPGVAASYSKSSKGEAPARQAAIPSARA